MSRQYYFTEGETRIDLWFDSDYVIGPRYIGDRLRIERVREIVAYTESGSLIIYFDLDHNPLFDLDHISGIMAESLIRISINGSVVYDRIGLVRLSQAEADRLRAEALDRLSEAEIVRDLALYYRERSIHWRAEAEKQRKAADRLKAEIEKAEAEKAKADRLRGLTERSLFSETLSIRFSRRSDRLVEKAEAAEAEADEAEAKAKAEIDKLESLRAEILRESLS